MHSRTVVIHCSCVHLISPLLIFSLRAQEKVFCRLTKMETRLLFKACLIFKSRENRGVARRENLDKNKQGYYSEYTYQLRR